MSNSTIFNNLPTLGHYTQLMEYASYSNFTQLIEFDMKNMQFNTIEEIEGRMIALGFTQSLIDKAIEDIKDYKFIVDGIPTNELTLRQFLDNIKVEYEPLDRFSIVLNNRVVLSIVTNFDYLVYNMFYIERGQINLSIICPKVSCIAIYDGIPENDDDNFRMLSVEKFELLLDILEYEWVKSKYNVSELDKFKNKYIYEYWKNKNLGDFLEYIIFKLEKITLNYDLLYAKIFKSSSNFFTQILDDNKNTQKLYKLFKKYQNFSDNKLHYQLCNKLKDYINIEDINSKLEKENADLEKKIKELEVIIRGEK